MLWLRYCTITSAYGTLHSLVNLWDRTGSYYNYARKDTEKRQLLLVDKLVYAGAMTAIAPVYWPLLLYKNVRRAETSLHWKDAKDFNKPHLFLE